MNDLNRAPGDISSIRKQMARSAEFRGYGPVTLATTAIFAIAAGTAQARWLPDPANHIAAYLALWLTTAVVSGAIIATQTCARTRRIHSGMADEMIRMAVEQFLPSAVAGALLTLVLLHYVASAAWMLPGLWQITFGLGVFASCRFLPRPMALAGAWYLFTGLACIALASSRALSPWAMAIPYATGQLLIATILWAAARQEETDEN